MTSNADNAVCDISASVIAEKQVDLLTCINRSYSVPKSFRRDSLLCDYPGLSSLAYENVVRIDNLNGSGMRARVGLLVSGNVNDTGGLKSLSVIGKELIKNVDRTACVTNRNTVPKLRCVDLNVRDSPGTLGSVADDNVVIRVEKLNLSYVCICGYRLMILNLNDTCGDKLLSIIGKHDAVCCTVVLNGGNVGPKERGINNGPESDGYCCAGYVNGCASKCHGCYTVVIAAVAKIVERNRYTLGYKGCVSIQGRLVVPFI